MISLYHINKLNKYCPCPLMTQWLCLYPKLDWRQNFNSNCYHKYSKKYDYMAIQVLLSPRLSILCLPTELTLTFQKSLSVFKTIVSAYLLFSCVFSLWCLKQWKLPATANTQWNSVLKWPIQVILQLQGHFREEQSTC